MKITVNESMFRDSFHACGRGEQFSYEALGLIFEYMEDMDREMEQEIELDVVAICCELEEASAEDIAKNYNLTMEDALDDDDDLEAIVEDYLETNTNLIGKTDIGYVFVQF